MVRVKFGSTISDRMQLALDLASDWYEDKGLNINPNKTTVVPFTRRRELCLGALRLGQTGLECSAEMKYLGVILYKTLT